MGCSREQFFAQASARRASAAPAIRPTGDWRADVLQRIGILRRMPGFRAAKPNAEGLIGRAPNGLLVIRNVTGTALIGIKGITRDMVSCTGDAVAIKELHESVKMAALAYERGEPGHV